MKWKCPSCKYENVPAAHTCEMCGADPVRQMALKTFSKYMLSASEGLGMMGKTAEKVPRDVKTYWHDHYDELLKAWNDQGKPDEITEPQPPHKIDIERAKSMIADLPVHPSGALPFVLVEGKEGNYTLHYGLQDEKRVLQQLVGFDAKRSEWFSEWNIAGFNKFTEKTAAIIEKAKKAGVIILAAEAKPHTRAAHIIKCWDNTIEGFNGDSVVIGMRP